MTKKLILALLAQSVAMSDSPCAPEMPVASGNSWFGVGVDMGAAFVHGSVSQNVTDTSDTSTSKDEQKQVLNGGLLYLAPEIKNLEMNPFDSFKSNEPLEAAIPDGFVGNFDDQSGVGYLLLVPNASVASYKNSKVAVDFGGVPFNMADSSKKTTSTSAGFVGQLSFHYMTKIPETMMTVGLHAGIGYNGARSSLKMPMQTVNTSAPYTQNIKTADVQYINKGNAAAYTRQYVDAIIDQNDPMNPVLAGVALLDEGQAEDVRVVNKSSKEFDGKWVVTGDNNPPYVSYNSDSVHLHGQASTEGEDAENRVPVLLDGKNLGAFTQSKKNTDINSKATISSGFMLQAGTRLGAMIGNVFPHIRVGWAAYQLKAHITNQTCLNSGVDKEKSYSTKYEGNAAAIGGNGLGLKIANAEVTIGEKVPHYLGEDDYGPRIISSNNGTFSGKLIPDVGSDLSTRTVHSKYKWANALTLGAGIDWAYQNMTFGLYYQAAICQKVNFDNWKSDIVTGASAVTSLSKADKPKKVAAEYNGIATFNSSGVVTAVAAKTTEGTSKVNYTTSQPETVSMSPVFNTVMLSVKYCFKAA